MEKTTLTSGPHVVAGGREKAPRTEGVNQRRKRHLQNTPKARAAERLRGQVGWAVWAGRQAKAGGVGRPAEPSGLKSEEINLFE